MKERGQRFPRVIGRRQVLKAAAVAGAVVAVGGALVEAGKTWQALHPSRFQYDAFLAATATAASEQGLVTTLRPEGPFTEEMIQAVLRNTGCVILKLTDNSGILRSAFLARSQDGLYIVTALHRPSLGNAVGAVAESAAVETVRFGRPRIDNSFTEIAASKCTFASGGSKSIPQDVALISVPPAAFSSLEVPADGIPTIDDFIPSTGDPVLFASYPNEFRNHNLLRSITQGGVSRITDTESDQPYTWGFTGLVALGSSGGPVYTIVNGQLTGVGVVTQLKAYVEEAIASSIPFSTLRAALLFEESPERRSRTQPDT